MGWLRDRLLGRRSLEGGSWVGWHVSRALYGGIEKRVRVYRVARSVCIVEYIHVMLSR